MLALYGVGPRTAAMLLVAAGDHPERLRSEAAWAHLCATALPTISLNTVKARLRSIYRKLGVTSRSEAIERAVDLRLL